MDRPAGGGSEPGHRGYRRGPATWVAFGALFAFGLLNAVLGPALPYIRAVEHISYLVDALHQAAFALGGGLAGLLATRQSAHIPRRTIVAAGLTGGGLAALAVGYGTTPAVTIAGAFAMSLFGTSALIRLWAALADLHGPRRAVAMSEGEVSVSLAGILTPLLIGTLAATALGYRFAFALAAAAAGLAALAAWRGRRPEAEASRANEPTGSTESDGHRRVGPTLILVFAVVGLEFSLSFWLASYLNADVGLARNASASAVSGVYAANLAGRLLASRLARRATPERLLASALAMTLVGLPMLLAATAAPLVAAGIALSGFGIGALFPLTSALHVGRSRNSADNALGQVLAIAAAGQLAGPLAAGAIAQAAGLRDGLLILPALTLTAAAALYRHRAKALLADRTDPSMRSDWV